MDFQYINSDGQKIIGFEVKGTNTKDLFAQQHRDKKEHETPIKQLWDYMGNVGLDYGICTNYKEFILITKQYGYSKYYKFDFSTIKDNETRLREFIGIFSKERIIDKGFVEKLHHESIIEEREFTKEFYKLFHETRLMLIMAFSDNGASQEKSIHYAQIFLNRLIFMFFVSDSNDIPNKLFNKQMYEVLDSNLINEQSRLVFDQIISLFKMMDKGSHDPKIFGFNGGLFSEEISHEVYFKDYSNPELFSDILKHSKLKKSVNLDEYSKKIIKKYDNKLNPLISNLLIMDSFDFTTDVNVNILGHIFEQSISDLEDLSGNEISKRKKDGVYYTPEYITDYICRNTIIPYLSKIGTTTDPQELVVEYFDDIESLEKKFREIKILDPSCGSGAFLVKAVDILLEINKAIQDHKEFLGKYSGLDKWNEESEIRAIIENNIYGVDINKESVGITRLAMFLKIASSNRKLLNLSKNIQVGNSLIDNKKIDSKSFIWEDRFPEILNPLIKDHRFDIIIGNPPYGADISENQKGHFKNNYKSATGRFDSYFYFIEKGISLLGNHGQLGFIVPDTWLTNVQSQKLREFILNTCCIKQILGLPQNVFDDATVDTCLLFLQKEEKLDNRFKNSIEIPIYDKNAKIYNIQQEKFTQQTTVSQKLWSNDSRKLFNINTDEKSRSIIKKIKENTISLGDNITSMRRGVFCYRKLSLIKDFGEGEGIKILEKRLWHSDHKVDKNYKKELVGSDIGKYFLNWKNKTWFKYGKHIASYVEPKFFETDYIAVQRIRNPKLKSRLVATIIESGHDFYASSGLTSIISTNNNYSLYYLLAILNSNVMNWYYKQFFRDVNIKPIDLGELPIKKITLDEQKPFIELTEELLRLNQQNISLKQKFVGGLADEYHFNITSKITEFHKLEFDGFYDELKKQKIKFKPLQREEEREYFIQRKTDICSNLAKISIVENKLEQLIYDLYDIPIKIRSLFEN